MKNLNLDILGEYLVKIIRESTDEQGHRLTGRLSRSTQTEVKHFPDSTIMDIVREAYGQAIESGIPADRIPYSRGSGAKSSQYISGLLRYVRLRGMKPKKGQTQLGIAFAIAETHKKIGMPTVNSRKFSRTRRRTGAVAEAVNDKKSYIREQATIAIHEWINQIAYDLIRETINSEHFTLTLEQ